MAPVDEQLSSKEPAQNQKYDRQIRIWGEHGQAALGRASVCLINAGPTGTETLKNLVLPGIGAFTVVDGSPVTAADAGNNFFLPAKTHDSSGNVLNRAAAAASSLLELNDHVDGSYIPDHLSTFLPDASAAAAFVRKFSIVIATQLAPTDKLMTILAAGCAKANVPLLLVRSYGLVGALRVQVPQMCVLDAREDRVPDLRLYRPFPELASFVDGFDLAAIADSTTAAHVPFIIILVKALAEYRSKRGVAALPKTRDEKNDFAATVKGLRPRVCPDEAENFEEALKFSNLRLCYDGAADTPAKLVEILSDPMAEAVSALSDDGAGAASYNSEKPELPSPVHLSNRSCGEAGSSAAAADVIEEEIASFWLHVKAVRLFTEANDGQLPLAGSVPDMTADTTSYVTLQRIYAAKAAADAAEVLNFASKLSTESGVAGRFDEGSVRDFCKRLAGIRVLRFRSIDDEIARPHASDFLEMVEMNGATDPTNANSALSYYALLRAADCFREENGRYAGATAETAVDDLRLLRGCVAKVKAELGGSIQSSSLWCDEVDEVCRFAGGELHNVASYVGGVAAQEAVKIITRQFVPLNNTLMVNFANLTSASFQA